MTQFMHVTMSNHKSTELALKNLEVQVGQLAKQIADKSSNIFVANIEKNPMEECEAMLTRTKRFVEDKDEESVVHKKKVAEKKGTDGKKNNVRGESNQEKEKQIMVKKKEFNDQEKENEVEKEKENKKIEKDEKNEKEEKSRSDKVYHNGHIVDNPVQGLVYTCAKPIFIYVSRSIMFTQLIKKLTTVSLLEQLKKLLNSLFHFIRVGHVIF